MNKVHRNIPFVSIMLAALALASSATHAADSAADLKARFKERYPRLLELKAAGIVGESASGFVEFVKPGGGDAAAQKLVRAENDDRTELYKLIAARDGTTPEKVAQINARRRFEKAKPGEWLKDADGHWKKKEG